MTRLARFAIAVATLFLAACAALTGKHDAFTVYSPQLATPKAVDAVAPVPWQLQVETPHASDALATAHIAVMPSAGVLEVYPAARWRDPAPDLLRSLIVQAFDDSKRIVGVSGATSGLSAEYSLAIDLRDFQVELAGESAHAAIRLNAKMLDRRGNRIIAARAFEVEAPTDSTDVARSVGAFERALNELLPQIVEWTLQTGNMAYGGQ